jgi:regulatory protein RepA
MDSIGKGLDPLEALEHIDPAGLNYQEWLTVGMGLKEAGCPASFWEDWSRRDPARYHAGECLRKWETFHGASGGTPVAAGTVFKMALDRGWRPTLTYIECPPSARGPIRPDTPYT